MHYKLIDSFLRVIRVMPFNIFICKIATILFIIKIQMFSDYFLRKTLYFKFLYCILNMKQTIIRQKLCKERPS